MTDIIDRRRGYYLMLDDETCPIDRTIEGVNADNMLAYDIGFAVCDKNGNIYEKYSLVIAEVFYGERERMTTSYYANKLPKYFADIENGNRQLVTLAQAQKLVADVMNLYGTNVVVGHNIYFDVTSLNRTCEFYQGVGHYFFGYDTVFYDTMKMATDTICKQKSYIKFCEENGYLTSYGKPRKTAEVLYRYITDDTDFNEEHQGLADVEIQVAIMHRCFAQHKPMQKRLWD